MSEVLNNSRQQAREAAADQTNSETERDAEAAFKDMVAQAAQSVVTKRTFTSIADSPIAQDVSSRVAATYEARKGISA